MSGPRSYPIKREPPPNYYRRMAMFWGLTITLVTILALATLELWPASWWF